jgi:hypothetical protein
MTDQIHLVRGYEIKPWANLSRADLREANLSGADLRGADLSEANLSEANLSGANLSRADLSEANLSEANLREANLREANLREANLSGADLRGADLSGAIGLLNPVDWLNEHLEKNEAGYIAYKQFGLHKQPPKGWVLKPGSILTEVVLADRCSDCACGVNVATREWFTDNGNRRLPLWRILIRWEWAAGIVVPYHTNGKIRCSHVELLEAFDNWLER